ncbi:hypothetical protein [Bosea sp. TAF32]|uniref:hypothetical protein n=1 Tax=Bosea sp. TAF32 TaxID=3237482 RepID=UPI003F91BBFD
MIGSLAGFEKATILLRASGSPKMPLAGKCPREDRGVNENRVAESNEVVRQRHSRDGGERP